METKKWYSTYNSCKESGVRTSDGFICMLPKPTHFPGQDERYERELLEDKANAELIAKAPEMYKLLNDIIEWDYDMTGIEVREKLIRRAKELIKSCKP